MSELYQPMLVASSRVDGLDGSDSSHGSQLRGARSEGEGADLGIITFIFFLSESDGVGA